METISNSFEFAQATFGKAQLGDARRTKRLMDAATALAQHPGSSIPAACENNGSRLEGFYKLIRNDAVDPEAIRQAAFGATAEAVKPGNDLLLLIQDTTSISPVHPLREQLKTKPGSPLGYEVHTGMLVDAADGVPIGILGQLVWSRKHTKHEKKLLDVESAKWQCLDEQIKKQDIDKKRLIRVGDREADFFDYLKYCDEERNRFVIRAAQDRHIKQQGAFRRLRQAAEDAPIVGTREITIEQRGAQKKGLEQNARAARPRHRVTTMLRATRVELKNPNGKTYISVNIVYVTSVDNELEWLLLTQEPISTLTEVEAIVSYYEKRWLIEQFHKSWKSGCKVEERRMGSLDNFLRIMAITMPIALRLLRLQILANKAAEKPAIEALSLLELQVLWAKIERTQLPTQMPSCEWAYRSIAKLAGWTDSKRTGRIGVDTLWRGHAILISLADGWRAALEFAAQPNKK